MTISIKIQQTKMASLNISTDCFNLSTLEIVPPQVQLYIAIVYILTAILSLFGNLTVIIVQWKGKEAVRNIQKYLINLAVSDIIAGVICLPFSYSDFVLRRWIFPLWLCPVTQYLQLLR